MCVMQLKEQEARATQAQEQAMSVLASAAQNVSPNNTIVDELQKKVVEQVQALPCMLWPSQAPCSVYAMLIILTAMHTVPYAIAQARSNAILRGHVENMKV